MPYDLDWGDIFVESYNVSSKKATLIYNFNFDVINRRQDFINYSIAHIYWVNRNLPSGSRINAIYDLRGLKVEDEFIREFEKEVKMHLLTVDPLLEVDLTFNKK